MKAVSLFSGIGGIDLALSYAGFDIIAQVEIDEYCREVLAHHAGEYWPNAERFADVRDFGKRSIATHPDIIAGGFPCQPFSIAGNRQGESDNRNVWPEFRRIIGELRPRAVLLENVPAICSAYTDASGERQPAYALTVIGDLAALGFDASWGIVSAADAGGGHRRERWFCVAISNADSLGRHQPRGGDTGDQGADHTPPGEEWGNLIHATEPGREDVADAESERSVQFRTSRQKSTQPQSGDRRQMADADSERQPEQERLRTEEWGWAGNHRNQMADPAHERLQGRGTEGQCQSDPPLRTPIPDRVGEPVGDPTGTGLEGQNGQELRSPRSANTGQRALAEPGLGDAFDGFPSWLVGHRKPAPPGPVQFSWEPSRTVAQKGIDHKHKIKALGNAVFVPTVFAIAYEIRKAMDEKDV